ncbi:hypothetical protein EDC01DRAFT_368101 [Geopyxis carbonaria]|nr:hypothetical protein EDC01DRAFT_368101 [Geopyxis carbonaria]
MAASSIVFSIMRRFITKSILLLVAVPTIYIFFLREEFNSPSNVPSLRITGSAGLFQKTAKITEPFGENSLVSQNEGVSSDDHLGPWIIDPPLPSRISTKPFVIRFKCLWHHADLCPSKYVVILRGPTIYSPPVSAMAQRAEDPKIVEVEIRVPDPGEYKVYAWPDFEQCPKYWRENMKYPFNRGQVMGVPFDLTVGGSPAIPDSLEPCDLHGKEYNGLSDGRWIRRDALQSTYKKTEWMQSLPEESEWMYQPRSCKRKRYNMTAIADAPSISHILFAGDSVLRGSFCSQIWPKLSASGLADGHCTFVNDPVLYHVASKEMWYKSPAGRDIQLSFRFMDDKPVSRLEGIPQTIKNAPSHIVANLGLWLAPSSVDEYRQIVAQFLDRMYQLWPEATVIWRTTTDVMPMIQCFSDKGMTRAKIAGQRDASLEVVQQMKAKGQRIHVVDAYAMTNTRPDTGNDGRHWVIESPDEYGWLPKQRPQVNDAEKAVLDAVFEAMLYDDHLRSVDSRSLGSVEQKSA